MIKYTIADFRRQFPDDESCLEYIFSKRFPDAKGYYSVKGRKCFANAKGEQIHPVAGTIFEKSSTPLTLWFYAIYLFSASRNGVSAKELERQLGVTYKTAWRTAKQIRSLMKDEGGPLEGIVEVDETYLGGRDKMENGRKNKKAVMGMVERKGRVKANVIPNRETHVVLSQIKKNIKQGSHLMTDEFRVYSKAPKLGYSRSAIKHGRKHYVRGSVHTNTIEGFWSQMKRSIHGTYHSVSKKHLQSYVDEFSFRYGKTAVFEAMMARI